MEASTLLNDINSIVTGSNYNASDPVVHMSVSEAEKRMKKLERDFQHNYKNYKEARSNRYSFYKKEGYSSYRSSHAGYCIGNYKDLREQLQNDLEKLNKAEATQRKTEKPDYCKQFLLHGCKSLTQEKRILNQMGETPHQPQQQQPQQLENNDLVLKDRYWEINNFSYNQSKIPKGSSSKEVHKLLKRFKDTVKLRDEVTANGELVENPTTRDSLTISIKILTKAIKKLEKDRGREIVLGNGYEENKKRLDKKSEWMWKKCDEQKKSILELKKIHKDVCSKLHAQFIDEPHIWRKIYGRL